MRRRAAGLRDYETLLSGAGARAAGSEFAIVLHGKGVTLAGIAVFETAAEPSFPLLARAMRELPLIGLAESVIADDMRGGERFSEILVRDLERGLRRTTPDASEAVCLELHAYGRLI